MTYAYDAERHQSARLHGINERIKAARLELNRLNQQIFAIEDRATRAQAEEAMARNNRGQLEKRIQQHRKELDDVNVALEQARRELKTTREKKYQATRDHKAITERIDVAGNRLSDLRQQSAAARQEAEQAEAQAERSRKALAMHFIGAPDPHQTMTEAERAYVAAMRAHPEDAVEGPRRLRELNREIRHLKAVS